MLLLLAGTPLVVAGVFMRWAAGLLLLFQLPTTVFFETDSWYEQADSISVMGGVLLAVTVDEVQRGHAAAARVCPCEPHHPNEQPTYLPPHDNDDGHTPRLLHHESGAAPLLDAAHQLSGASSER